MRCSTDPRHRVGLASVLLIVAAALSILLSVPAWAEPNRWQEGVAPRVPLVPDISDEEWAAAIPAKGSGIAEPKQLKGPKQFDIPYGLPKGRYYVTVSVVLRADGTQGVYRLVDTNSRGMALSYIKYLRKQRFSQPQQGGAPVALRGDVSFEFRVDR